MARKTVMNLVVLLLAINQVVQIATPRELPPPASQTIASSLLVTSISGTAPSGGLEVSHGHGAKEEKILLDAPNIPFPSSPPLQDKMSTLATSLLVTSVSGPSSGDFTKAPSSTQGPVLLDAPNNPVPSFLPVQGKKTVLASPGV